MEKDVLFDGAAFDDALAAGAAPLPLFRDALRQAHAVLARRFERGAPIVQLVRGRAWVVDQLLARAWQHLMAGSQHQAALVAVGGYGRGELHPYSDIDLMVLLPVGELPALHQALEGFLLFLWDMGLEVGHSVRSVADCEREGRADITVATNLMESRLLGGDAGLYYAMRQVVGPDHIWPVREFFAAKWQEQIARHRKFHDTAYNLEPNVKEGPGGLRDIQMIGWVAKRHFGGQTLDDLVGHGFLTPGEYRTLIDGQNFLWRVRFGLHLLARRREDRLLFDHQRALARQFGYQDEDATLAVEQFMKRYYRTVMELGQLNEMLLQLFQEKILLVDEPAQIVPLNRRFQTRNGFLEVSNDLVFRRQPFALLELFLLLAQHEHLKGIRAETIRLIRSHLHLIDDEFRADLRCRSLFMELLRQPRGVHTALRHMNRFGLLGAYLPAFGRIVGQMQHDLFHVYTVDEHTLFVLRNVRRYAYTQYKAEFPLCSELMDQIPKREVLYVAALFHDIAKGRGGDHSVLGAEEVTEFCRNHQLSDYDTRLAAWLVRNHLLMSATAQRQDINDPDVVNAFAAAVGDRVHLDYLYLLTIADIRATSPTLWNSWKGTLLNTLYNSTRNALRRGLTNPIDADELIAETKEEARKRVRDRAVSAQAIDALWSRLDDDYFLRYTIDAIAWHTESIIAAQDSPPPLILIRQQTQHGGTEVFIYTPRHDNLFALTTSTLDQMGLTITDARIMTSRDGYTLDTYIVLEEDGAPVSDAWRIQELETTLHDVLAYPDAPPQKVERRLPRQLKHFTIPTQVIFQPDPYNDRTVMEVISSDRPGLLSQIGKALMECNVRLQNAKIATLGARVEDIFFITDAANQPLHDTQQMEQLRQRIAALLAP
ncbi:[protein-PII] uridylyltransferase [Sulfurivermis fontis]|uniref:[protein-PII] uridylyltransferase n=1 Tax=Sulfurivermis fontis TaxID=1972068 RepID=UPI000FD9680D|nr:[protein-PII] uridylyltransferase [Sulfurivermis fontis]